jgi:hypothetical protein
VGTFLLQKDNPECMNCHKTWDYSFLSSQMTKAYMKKDYKEHIKEILIREIESGLGDYQEIATTANQKETVLNDLKKAGDRLDTLEDQEFNRVLMDVGFLGRTYKIYYEIDRMDVPETRRGTLMIRYIESLVNPPPTEKDKELALEEQKKRLLEINLYKIGYKLALLNMNVFYHDKNRIVLALPPSHTPQPDNQEYLKELNELETQLKDKIEKIKDLRDRYIENPDMTLSEVDMMIETIRRLYIKFWEKYYLLYPVDTHQIQTDKDHYCKIVNEQREKLLNTIWKKDEITHFFNSNKKYIYNLDDSCLYRLDDDKPDLEMDGRVSGILAEEETKWGVVISEHNAEMDRMLPLYKDLNTRHNTLNRKLRLLNKNKTLSGDYIHNCPKDGCLGKLGDGGRCGMCEHHFCLECMTEKDPGHECKKDDVASVLELKKTTRPCPKCSILIYKTEGCDQMWCVKCHTTFSWKTGAISNGVVHNPHFYSHRQEITRTPGDIPCGGLPNEVEIIMAIAKSPNTNDSIYDIWDHCDMIAEDLMPRIYQKFNNVRPVKYRRYSIAYMRGKIDKKKLGVSLFRNYMDEIRYAHYYDILGTYVDNIAEYMRQFVRGIPTEKECVELLRLLQHDIGTMNMTFGMNEYVHSPI